MTNSPEPEQPQRADPYELLARARKLAREVGIDVGDEQAAPDDEDFVDIDAINPNWPKRTPDRLQDLEPTASQPEQQEAGFWRRKFAQTIEGMKAIDAWRQRFVEAFNPDQPRDERGRWTATGARAIVQRCVELVQRLGGGKRVNGLPVPVPKNPAQVRAMWERAVAIIHHAMGTIPPDHTGGQLLRTAPGRREFMNTARTVDELLADAKRTRGLLKDVVTGVAKDAEARPFFGPGNRYILKGKGSLTEKVDKRAREWFEGDDGLAVQAISDAVRGTVITDTPTHLGEAARALDRRVREVGGYLAWEDKTAPEKLDKNGYVAVHADVYLPVPGAAGHWIRSEVQLHLKDINDGSETPLKEFVHATTYKPKVAAAKRLSDRERGAASTLMFLSALAPLTGVLD